MAQYDSSSIEKRWEEMWKKEEIYRFDPKSDKPVFSIDNPPRYTSGSLHLGHATGYSLIDFAARYKRMRGYNVFFPLCFDVNGTPIEVKVEKKHGITKLDTPRQEYRRLRGDDPPLRDPGGEHGPQHLLPDRRPLLQEDHPALVRGAVQQGPRLQGELPRQLVPRVHDRPRRRGGRVQGQRQQAQLHQVPDRGRGRSRPHRHHQA